MTAALGCPHCGCCELIVIMSRDGYGRDCIDGFQCCKCRAKFVQGAVEMDAEEAKRALK